MRRAKWAALPRRRLRTPVDAPGRLRHRAWPSMWCMVDRSAIDALQREIEEKAILTIARRQPMAIDLREIVGALRVSNDLERIGDLAKNIAKRVVATERRVPRRRS